VKYNIKEENKIKLTILIDNNTIIDRYFLAEPGLSFYIEEDDKKILFDVGYSNAFLINAQKMRINLLDSDYVVISHGHLDHTWGLPHLINLITEAVIEKQPCKKAELVAHPDAFSLKIIPEIGPIGSIVSVDMLNHYFSLKLSQKPRWLTPNVVFLGEIPRKYDFEAKNPIGKTMKEGEEIDDYLIDDTAIAVRSSRGLIVITGCSHAGICNIVEYARQICQEDKVYDIIGGFHLLDPSQEQIENTVKYLENLNPDRIHACHCVDLPSKIALSRVANLVEVGSGIVIEY